LQHPEKGKIKGATALDIFNQIINALADGERARLFHGDLKPSNVLVSSMADGRPHVKITDFPFIRPGVISHQKAFSLRRRKCWRGRCRIPDPIYFPQVA
jgi:serine/threonine protein kinase